MDDDPEPACPPPAWAAELIDACNARVGLEVYPPSDDTFLLLEALAGDTALRSISKTAICLELGPGSGAVSAGLAELLQNEAPNGAPNGTPNGTQIVPFLMAIDKNPAAARCTSAVFHARQVILADVIQGSLTDCLRETGLVDIVICNPPYVPTDEDEMQGCGISVSWAGGKRGREVIDVLMPKVARILVDGGLFYLVCIAENDPEEVLKQGRSLGFLAEKIKQEQRGMEELFILRFKKTAEAAEAPEC
eukprot:Skav200643  [mRNA]  locus=scaffold2539:44362:45108:+ [translate_table: standard]